MKIYNYKKIYRDIDFKLISEDINKIMFFDIETTGLSPKTSDLYMIGYACADGDYFDITLLFNDDGCSEPEILRYFSDVLSQYRTIVTYNGTTFDIPYIKEKYKQFDIEENISDIESMDIYKHIKKYKKILHMSSMKQSDIESLLHIRRDDFISGGELIQVYKQYLISGFSSDLDELIRHNLDDVSGLIQITNILSVQKLYGGGYEISSCSKADSGVDFELKLNSPLPVRINYGCNKFHINAFKDYAKIHITTVKDTLKYYFKDYKNYYYLPLEDMCIHKSIAACVDNEYKIKATKDTAYVKKEGIYITCPRDIGLKLFSYNINSNEKYILLDDTFLSDCNIQKLFIKTILNEKTVY